MDLSGIVRTPVVRRNLWPAIGALAFVVAYYGLGIPTGLDRSAPVEYRNGDAVVKEVAPGGQLTIEWLAHWKRPNCHGLIRRWVIYSGRSPRFHNAAPIISPDWNEPQIYETSVDIKRDAPPGTAYYWSEGEYWCHWLQYFWTIKVKTLAVPFTIVSTPPKQ